MYLRKFLNLMTQSQKINVSLSLVIFLITFINNCVPYKKKTDFNLHEQVNDIYAFLDIPQMLLHKNHELSHKKRFIKISTPILLFINIFTYFIIC